jgi:polar amino acid transport system permease protein
MKTTAIVAAVAYTDLLYQANDLAQKTFRPLEVFTTVALIYFVCVCSMSIGARVIERRGAVTGDTTVR